MGASVGWAETSGGVGEPALSYLICATPRSGSTFLCEALRGTGISGYPREHFEVLLETGRPRRPRDYFQRSNDPEVWALLDDPEFREILGDRGGWYGDQSERVEAEKAPDFGALLRQALREGTSDNGVFGTKIMWAYFRDFVRLARRTPGGESVRPCGVPAFVFPKMGGYVWIRRRDTVRQAVSLWKALQSWQWRKDHDDEITERELRFDFAAVDHLRLRIDEHNVAWRTFFERCGVEPVEVVYESLIEDYEETMGRVLEGVGVPLPDGFVPERPRMRRQADKLSEEWVRLYHEGARERGPRPVLSRA